MLVIPYTPRGPSPLVPIVFALGFACGLITGATTPARADAPAVLGFRIEVRACRGTECRDLASPHPVAGVGGQFTCQARAETMRVVFAAAPPKRLSAIGLAGPGWAIRTRCVPVRGDARA